MSGVTVRKNVISGNDSHGISLSGATGTSVTGNFIGTVQGGASALANTGSGVHITGAATGNEVLDNVIAFNGGDGVTIESSSALKNGVRRNAIHSNTGLGIDLAPDGVTANDAGDGDTGPNGLQNFPVLTAAVVGGDRFEITGSLNSTAGTLFGLDFYSNTSCDPSDQWRRSGLAGQRTQVHGRHRSIRLHAQCARGGRHHLSTGAGRELHHRHRLGVPRRR